MAVLSFIVAKVLPILELVSANSAVSNVHEVSSGCHSLVILLIDGITLVLAKFGMPILAQVLGGIVATHTI